MTESTDPTLAQILDLARERFGGTAAEFDYSIVAGGPIALKSLIQPGSSHIPAGDAWRDINNTIFELATAGMADASHDEREASAAALRERLTDELDGYAATCRARNYVGWSAYSTGPIRYADGE